MWYGILNSTYYFGMMTLLLNCCSECESVSAVTDSIKYGSVVVRTSVKTLPLS